MSAGGASCHKVVDATTIPPAKDLESTMTKTPDVRLRRIYDPPAAEDGIRVLVDRRWPRGVSKARADLDEWCRSVAPSDALRRWYGHVPERFDEFEALYRAELKEPDRASALRHLSVMAAHDRLTLLTATKRVELSQAAVLANLLSTSSATP
jgi:uncharacterized protein YeaO (DUF488 family)